MLTGACFLLYKGYLGAQLFIRRVPVFTILQVIVTNASYLRHHTSYLLPQTSYLRHHTSYLRLHISLHKSLIFANHL